MFTLSFTDTRFFFCRRYLFLIKNKGKFPLFFFSNHIAYANFNAPILSAQETRERALKANMINSESKKIWYVAYFSEDGKKISNENMKSILKFETNIRIQISLKKNYNFFSSEITFWNYLSKVRFQKLSRIITLNWWTRVAQIKFFVKKIFCICHTYVLKTLKVVFTFWGIEI